VRELLERLEESGTDPSVPLSYLAGRSVELDEAEVHGAVRRAELLLATGGDPRRALDPDGRAVESLAADLDGAAPRSELRTALDRLAADATGLPRIEAALAELTADDDRAWRAYACALLADALADSD